MRWFDGHLHRRDSYGYAVIGCIEEGGDRAPMGHVRNPLRMPQIGGAGRWGEFFFIGRVVPDWIFADGIELDIGLDRPVPVVVGGPKQPPDEKSQWMYQFEVQPIFRDATEPSGPHQIALATAERHPNWKVEVSRVDRNGVFELEFLDRPRGEWTRRNYSFDSIRAYRGDYRDYLIHDAERDIQRRLAAKRN